MYFFCLKLSYFKFQFFLSKIYNFNPKSKFKSHGLGMGGEVASQSDRSECEARTARPAFTERDREKIVETS